MRPSSPPSRRSSSASPSWGRRSPSPPPCSPPKEPTDMLIHPWDAALEPAEWQQWLATTDHFGLLAVNNLDPAQAPWVLPTHFTPAGDELLMHLARPTPVWPHLEAGPAV